MELEQVSKVVINEQCSTKVIHNIPTKMRDSGILTVRCEFGNSTKTNILANYGANLNLMRPHLTRSLISDDLP